MSLTLTKAGANFVTNGLRIGDEMDPSATVITGFGDTDNEKFKVIGIASETVITYDGFIDGIAQGFTTGTTGYQTGNSVTFTFKHVLNKDEQIDEIVGIAQGYGSKRVVLIWPGEAEWYDDTNTLVTLDGSACAAAFAAAVSSYPAQQSFTNLGFSGPYKLHYSNSYFTPAQLNRLSEAGVCVLVQNSDGSQVFSRHQKTTSSVSIQEQEFSITKAVDKVSLDMWNLVHPFIGKYNISTDLLVNLEEILGQYLFAAKNHKAPYCGGLIINSSGLVLRANLLGQNLDLPPATIEITVEVEVGYPANYITINLLVK